MMMPNGEMSESEPEAIFEDAAELERAWRQPISLGKRVAQFALGACVAVLAVVFIVRPSLVLGIGAFAAAPPMGVVAHIPLHSTVNYGTVTVNGHSELFLPSIGIPLYAGKNVITLTAPPFAPVTCVLHQPRRANDTCQSSESIPGEPGGILLPLTLDDLPMNLHAAALQTISATFDGIAHLSATVQSGEDYLTALNTDLHSGPLAYRYQTAHQPLAAALMATARLPESCIFIGPLRTCTPIDITFDETAQQVWGVDVSLTLTWQFATTQGQIVAQVPERFDDFALLLHHDVARGWQLVADHSDMILDTPTTATFTQMLEAAGCLNSLQVLFQLSQTPAVSAIAFKDISSAGCRATFMTQPATSGVGEGFTAAVLVRFGVALAADGATKHAYPQLPLATTQELAAFPVSPPTPTPVAGSTSNGKSAPATQAAGPKQR